MKNFLLLFKKSTLLAKTYLANHMATFGRLPSPELLKRIIRLKKQIKKVLNFSKTMRNKNI